MEQMMITRLYLKNFIPIRSVHHKDEIDLRFPEDKVINLFYGDMGTCKTFILGHLQPWHNFGTLDVRNQDKMVPENENGKKIIEYKKGDDVFVITHDYLSGGKTTKHYIQKNGEELNENGNLKTFNDVIAHEFGIEPEMLKLIRIGENVTNLLKMNSVDRKKLVASLRKDTDIYLMIHKKMTQDYRILNAQLSGLSQRLTQMNYERMEQYSAEYELLEAEISANRKKLEEFVWKKSNLWTDIKNRLGGSLDSFLASFRSLSDLKHSKEKELQTIEEQLLSMSNLPSIDEVSKKIGALDNSIEMYREMTTTNEVLYENKSKELEALRDKKRVSNDAEQMRTLKDTFKYLHEKSLSYQSQLSSFKIKQSTAQLIQINNELEELNMLIMSLREYNIDDVIKIFNADSSILRHAKEKIDIITAMKIKKQKEANNLRYSSTYSATTVMFRPPFCPTKECPYYVTHPVTIKEEGEDTSIKAQIDNMMAEVDRLDNEIYRYCDYTPIYQKCQQVKSLWNNLMGRVKSLDIIIVDKLELIISGGKYSNWYSPSKMNEIIDLSNKREEMYTLNQRLTEIKDELTQLELSVDGSIDEKISEYEKNIEAILDILKSTATKITSATDELKRYNDIYLQLSNLSILTEQKKEVVSTLEELGLQLSTMEENQRWAESANVELESLNQKELLIKSEIEKLSEEYNNLGYKILDIKRTKEEYGNLLEEKEVWTDILESVSPKSGIPLVAVQMYLNEAKDDINELIAEVDDDFEIATFHITDDDFQIPYIANGELINDVSKASQGEKSIVNIAIPFALMQNSGIDYNIMLLDEVDAALHASQRNAFPSILFKQLRKINSRQIFMISHNWTYDGYPVNIILTSEENLTPSPLRSITKV